MGRGHPPADGEGEKHPGRASNREAEPRVVEASGGIVGEEAIGEGLGIGRVGEARVLGNSLKAVWIAGGELADGRGEHERNEHGANGKRTVCDPRLAGELGWGEVGGSHDEIGA